jgi:hypothetical protein
MVTLALFLFGSVSPDLRHFYVAMLVGVISGTYSSIFNASQIIVDWENWRLKIRERETAAIRAGGTAAQRASMAKPSAKPAASVPPTTTETPTAGTATGNGSAAGKPKQPSGRAVGKPPKRKKRF